MTLAVLVALVMVMGLVPAGVFADSVNTNADFEVEYMAAPAVAGLLLEEAGIDNRYGQGRDGGNYIRDVAHEMGPGTDFNGVEKTNVEDYWREVALFLKGKGLDVGADLFEAELLSVVYEGTCTKFGSHLGETLTLTFSNDVFIPGGCQVAAGTEVHFEEAWRLGNMLEYMEYEAVGNVVTITVVGTFGDHPTYGARPEVGDLVNDIIGMVDFIGNDVVVPEDGVEIEFMTYHYHWGPGVPYGATEETYAVAIVNTCGMEVWWLEGSDWKYDVYSISKEDGYTSYTAGNLDEWVKTLFNNHFPDVSTVWYLRTSIDPDAVPEPVEGSTLLK